MCIALNRLWEGLCAPMADSRRESGREAPPTDMKAGVLRRGWSRIGLAARRARGIALVVALLGGAGAGAHAAEALDLFGPSAGTLPIFVAADAAPDDRAAAAELARVVVALGADSPPVVGPEPAAGAGPGIYVGRTRAAAALHAPLRAAADWFASAAGEVGPDAIRLTANDGRLFVEAATPEATPFAVAWLLQRYADVHWFFPGPDGESVPSRGTWSVSGVLSEVRQPAFVSRDLFLSGSADDAAWAVRNGLRARIEFGHALNRVFTAAEFDAHPAWFPVVRGQRLRPRDADDHHWQPSLARPDVAEFAAARARAAFAADPARRSFALGMNDTVRFDQGPETRTLVEPLRWFRGMPDYSPLVFTFMNRAAATLDADPAMNGRYLGCLAYFWCENAPPFPVDPRVVPFLTTDRSQFFDQTYGAAEVDLLARWGRSGVKTFGLWDYAYGSGFLVPRVPVRGLAHGIRAGYRAGARGYFADAGPEWGFDAFKLWAIARLLWEPERSIDELSDEYFPAAYGSAWRPMREFFERSEAKWMGQGGAAYWLKLHQHEDQALLFPVETCLTLRALLDAARAAGADDAAIAARIERTSRAFAVTEALAAFDAVRRPLAREADADESENEFAETLAEFVRRRAEFEAAVRQSGSATSPDFFTRNDPVPRRLVELAAGDPAAPQRLLAKLEATGVVVREWRELARWLARGPQPSGRSVVRNGDFARGGDGQGPPFLFPRGGALPAEWEWRAVAAERQAARLVPAPPPASEPVLRIEGAWDTQVFQWNPAKPGCAYVARVHARAATSAGSDAGLFLSFLDAAGKPVGVHRMQTVPHATADAGRWRTLVLAGVAPADAAWVGVGLAASRQVGDDWFEAMNVELTETDADRETH